MAFLRLMRRVHASDVYTSSRCYVTRNVIYEICSRVIRLCGTVRLEVKTTMCPSCFRVLVVFFRYLHRIVVLLHLQGSSVDDKLLVAWFQHVGWKRFCRNLTWSPCGPPAPSRASLTSRLVPSARRSACANFYLRSPPDASNQCQHGNDD